eukprot:Blabericola_migrator_1__6222@NODE_313_length_10046_cov_122_852390_g256_i0_p1_GENE_NODE_313_length_10046_cov_122_852390_g256_i0NODE_313_length_10046_cov_122_852390_g256_i0_p1_ORF_typecomplete_len761_score66_36_NODE_313_length_10046_cov_122_852390_g256_i049917273
MCVPYEWDHMCGTDNHCLLTAPHVLNDCKNQMPLSSASVAADDYLSTLLKVPYNNSNNYYNATTGDESQSAAPSWDADKKCAIGERLAKYLNPWIDHLDDPTPHGECCPNDIFKDLETPSYAVGAFKSSHQNVGGAYCEDDSVWEINDAVPNNGGALPPTLKEDPLTNQYNRHYPPTTFNYPSRHKPQPPSHVPTEQTPAFLKSVSNLLLTSHPLPDSPHEFGTAESLRVLASAIYIVSKRLCPVCSPSRAPRWEESIHQLNDHITRITWESLRSLRSHDIDERQPRNETPSMATSLSFVNATLVLLLVVHRLQKMESLRRNTDVTHKRRRVPFSTVFTIVTTSLSFLSKVQKLDHNKESKIHPTGGCCMCPGFDTTPEPPKPKPRRLERLITSNSALQPLAKMMVGRPLTSSSSTKSTDDDFGIRPASSTDRVCDRTDRTCDRGTDTARTCDNKGSSKSSGFHGPKQRLLSRIFSDVKQKSMLLPLAARLHSNPVTGDTLKRQAVCDEEQGRQSEVIIRDCAAVTEIIRRFCSAVFVASAWVDELEPISSPILGDFLTSCYSVLSRTMRCRRVQHRSQFAVPFPSAPLAPSIPSAPSQSSDSFSGMKSRAVQLKRIAAVTASTISGACMNSDSVELIESPTCLICREPKRISHSTPSAVKQTLGLTPLDFERLTFHLLSDMNYELRIEPLTFWDHACQLLNMLRNHLHEDPWTAKPLAAVSSLGSTSILTSTSCNSVSTTVPSHKTMPSFASSWVLDAD